MNVTCAVCQAKTDANLCKACTAELERAIAELPADLADLQLVATRQAAGPLGLGRGHQWDGPFEEDSLGDAPWDFAPGAADQLWATANTVATWARHLAETRGIPGPAADRGTYATVRWRLTVDRNRAVWLTRRVFTPSPEQPIRTVVNWLLANLDAIRLDEAAAQIHEELTGLHDENAAWILGRNTDEEFAGNCDATQIGFEQRPRFYVDRNRMHVDPNGPLVPVAARCGVALYGRSGEPEVRCQACGTRYPLQARLDDIRERQINDQLARAHVIADALTTLEEPLGRDLLRKWIERDALRDPAPEGPACETCRHPTCRAIRRPPILPQGVDEERHPLYRFGDVRRRLQLVQEQRGIRLSA